MKITCKEDKRNERDWKITQRKLYWFGQKQRAYSSPQGKHLEISLYQAFITG
jgi:hypothetical protein